MYNGVLPTVGLVKASYKVKLAILCFPTQSFIDKLVPGLPMFACVVAEDGLVVNVCTFCPIQSGHDNSTFLSTELDTDTPTYTGRKPAGLDVNQ